MAVLAADTEVAVADRMQVLAADTVVAEADRMQEPVADTVVAVAGYKPGLVVAVAGCMIVPVQLLQVQITVPNLLL